MTLTHVMCCIYAQIFSRKSKMMSLFGVFPMARRVVLPLLLAIYLSANLLSDAQHHRASTGWKAFEKNIQCFKTREKRPLYNTPLSPSILIWNIIMQ
jgi:hypothetical protein